MSQLFHDQHLDGRHVSFKQSYFVLQIRHTVPAYILHWFNSSSPAESRDMARRALIQYSFAEGLLGRISTHAHEGLASVDAAQTATLQAMSLLTRWREGS